MLAPRFLIIETSGRVGQVALAEGAKLLRQQRLDEARRHARDLAPAIAMLLHAQGWNPRDVHAVLVSHGPGSYTGLRVGIMSAKAFAFATGSSLLAISTFAAVALQAPAGLSRLEVIADAQQDKLYAQPFFRNETNSMWSAERPLAIHPLSDWLSSRDNAIALTGPGLRVFGDRLPPETPLVPVEAWDPRPESLSHLGLVRYRDGERDDIWSAEPLYLRSSSAEEKLRAPDDR
jgi:tRNA threonylcarbamoyladenosine biosynthesis protein TsaB